MPVKQRLRVIYAGTPEFAVPPLVQLLQYPHAQVVAILTQPDRPSGRGQRFCPSPVKQLATAHNINVLQPESIKKNPDFIQKLKELKPDLMVVAAYGLILPVDLLAIPIYGCINIHASLLPAWRGAAPIQRALLAGDQVTGISIMQMDQGLDTGDILLTKPCVIKPEDTAASLHDKLSMLGAEAMVETLDKILEQQLNPVKQNHQAASYAEKIRKDEARIDWSQSAEVISQLVKGLNPKPVAFTYLQGQRIKVWQSQPVSHPIVVTMQKAKILPGMLIKVSHQELVVQCGQGELSIEKLQLPGKKIMSIAEVIRGYGSLFQLNSQFMF